MHTAFDVVIHKEEIHVYCPMKCTQWKMSLKSYSSDVPVHFYMDEMNCRVLRACTGLIHWNGMHFPFVLLFWNEASTSYRGLMIFFFKYAGLIWLLCGHYFSLWYFFNWLVTSSSGDDDGLRVDFTIQIVHCTSWVFGRISIICHRCQQKCVIFDAEAACCEANWEHLGNLCLRNTTTCWSYCWCLAYSIKMNRITCINTLKYIYEMRVEFFHTIQLWIIRALLREEEREREKIRLNKHASDDKWQQTEAAVAVLQSSIHQMPPRMRTEWIIGCECKSFLTNEPNDIPWRLFAFVLLYACSLARSLVSFGSSNQHIN